MEAQPVREEGDRHLDNAPMSPVPDALGGTLGGGALGGALGIAAGPVGALIGAAIGGVAGAALGTARAYQAEEAAAPPRPLSPGEEEEIEDGDDSVIDGEYRLLDEADGDRVTAPPPP